MRTGNIIGVDIGGTKCAVIAAERTDSGCKINSKTAFPTLSCTESIDKICGIISDYQKSAGTPIEAIGISCGGPLNEETGTIMSPPNLPSWDNVPITAILTEKFKAPAYLRNDANACALAEWKFGAGRGLKNVIFLTFGTGMGAGLILNSKLYSGTNGNAGEVGHMRVSDFGPVGYGKAGSFEGFCSGGGLRQIGQTLALEQIQRGTPAEFCRTADELDRITAKLLAEYAEKGDETAKSAYRLCGQKLGHGLSILIDLLNPEAIILGSIFTRAESLLRDEAESVIRREALTVSADVCRILPAQLGEQIGDYAAVAAAVSE